MFLRLASSANYAILFAGSYEWVDYRHQADIFTLYQNLVSRKFDTSKIIMFAYDSIAYHPNNLYPGQVFHSNLRKNVYPGKDVINFTGSQVTPENLYSTLLNLPTTQNDNIFFFYNDHGMPEAIGTPSSFIYSWDFMEVLSEMHEKKKFNKMFIGIEACYSGTFTNRMDIPDVAIVTAARYMESSSADLPDSFLQYCLSDEFSSYFFEALDKDLTIKQLFNDVKDKMQASKPTIGGSEEDQNLRVSNFIGLPPPQTVLSKIWTFTDSFFNQQKPTLADVTKKNAGHAHVLEQIESKTVRAQSIAIVKQIVQEVAGPENIEKYMKSKATDKSSDNYQKVLKLLLTKIGHVNTIGGDVVVPIQALCADYDADAIISSINKII